MNTQNQPTQAPKSIKQKSNEELEKDVLAMSEYKNDQLRIQSQGEAARAELATRLGHELNLKGGKDLLVDKLGSQAISKASKKQYDPSSDFVLLAVAIDNHHAQNPTQTLDENKVKSILQTALTNHLPNGTHAAAISLKAMQKDNLRAFQEAFMKFSNAVAWHNKSTAGEIVAKYKHPFSFQPQKYIPEEI